MFDLYGAFDKVWKEGPPLKLLQAGVRHSVHVRRHHFLFARSARVQRDGHFIVSKKFTVREGVAIWSASEHTSTATYRLQEVVHNIDRWTEDWGLEINQSKTN